jgi:lipoprotein NlpI
LLISLLARLNIPATPVLVSASLHAQAFELLPGPLDFDHVIARVELEGSTYWIDATRSHQSGELSQRQPLGLGEGLPLTSDTSAPVPLPNAYDSERLLVNDIIRFKMIRDDPTLESRVTFRGDLAEGLRESLATKSTSEIAAQVSAPYLKTYPKARTTGALQIESSSVDDAVTLVQTFVIADFWRLPEPQATLVSQVVPYAVVEALTFPRMEMRRQPLLFPLTGIIRHSIVIEYPENVYWQAPAARFEDGDAYLTLRERVQGTPRRVEYSSELRINSDQVAPEDWPAFAAKVDELDHKLGFNVSIPPIPLEQVDEVTRKLKAAAEHEPHVSGEGADSLSPAKRIMLAAEIDGGRLPPHLEAQVRAERGAFDDQEGLAAQAAADFRRALELFPESAEVLHGAALNALQLQQLDRAIDLASTALQLSAHDEISLETRARARYLKKDLAGARADLEEMLKNPDSVRRGYPLVWLGFTLRQSAQEGASATTAYASGLPTEWPRPLIDLAANRTDPQSVLSAARARKNSAQSLCEAYFYIGEDYYTRGNLEQARRSWQKATEQGAAGPVEDGAARLRLQSVLGK